MNRRDTLKTVAAAPLAWLGAGSAVSHAQDRPYPNRPISLVVPFAPGNSADFLARQVAQQISGYMGQSVVVENRPGAGGVGAIKQVAAAAPDGYTLLLLGAAATITQTLFKPQPYDLLKQFSPVSGLTEGQLLVLVSKNSPIHALEDFIRDARARKDGFLVGVSLLGTTQHLTAEFLKLNARLDYTIVPFKSASEVAMALQAGDIHASVELVPASLGLVQGGQLRALAVSGDRRSSLLPEVPTMTERGMKDFRVTSWGMIVAPARTPEPVVQRLNQEIQRALREPEIARRFEGLGLSPLGGSAAQAQELVASEVKRWAEVIEQARISLK